MNKQPQVSQGKVKGKFVFIGIIALLIIIGLSVSWFLIIKPAVTEEEMPEVVEGNFTIAKLELCNNIDENYACDENPTGEFNVGSDVWLKVTVKNIFIYETNNQYYVDISEYLDVSDTNLNQVDSLSGELIHFNHIFSEKPSQIILKNRLITQNLTKGGYLVDLSVVDNINHHIDFKSISFELK